MKKNQTLVLGLQNVFVMFSATTLVPILVGVPISVALFAAGFATLIFHLITKLKVPIFLGSSFAYIAPMIAVTLYYINEGGQNFSSIQAAINSGMDITPMLAYATGGILVAGILQAGIGVLIKLIGVERIIKFFPPVISGTTVLIIGLILSPVAISMAASNWTLAIIALSIAIIVRLYVKGFSKLLPVLLGIFITYMIAIFMKEVDFSGIQQASVIEMPPFFLPKFSLHALFLIVPVALAASVESIADIYAVSSVVGKKFYKDPGLHRTLIGDGIGTMLGGLMGAPANTTYSENTGVLALTKVYNPVVMRIAAIVAIILSFIPKFAAFIYSIPQSIMGGISILLFGMISAVGLKTLIDNKVQVEGKNLIIITLMLVLGLGGAALNFGLFSLEGVGLAVIVGLVLNIIFLIFPPKNK